MMDGVSYTLHNPFSLVFLLTLMTTARPTRKLTPCPISTPQSPPLPDYNANPPIILDHPHPPEHTNRPIYVPFAALSRRVVFPEQEHPDYKINHDLATGTFARALQRRGSSSR